MNIGVDQPLPVDGAIQIAFDRYLLPSTVNRQSLGIVDAANMPLPASLAPVVTYDPIARTVTVSRPQAAWLTQGQTYRLLLAPGGLRAIDGAALAEQKLNFTFIVGPPSGVRIEPPVSFCRDVLPIMVQKCGSTSTCHASSDRAASSLVLTTSAGVGATALNRIAQGSNTGGRASGPPSAAPIFGVDMPIIDPGNPGNSWLLYKIDLARLPTLIAEAPDVCVVNEKPMPFVFAPLVPQAQRTADEIERAILSNFILGREMPFPALTPGGYPDTALTFDEREKVRIWIAGLTPGAALPECRECIPAPTPDAGITDASGTDAADAADAAD